MKKFDNNVVTAAPAWQRPVTMIVKPMLAALAMVFSANTYACNLLPGSSCLLTGTTESAEPDLAGTVLQDVTRAFSIDLGGGASISGTVQDRVVREANTGTLDFYCRLFNDCMSAGSLGLVSRTGYSGQSTEVNYRLDGLGNIAPTGASRVGGSGSDVAFGFLSDPIGAGDNSKFFFIKTGATNYDENGNGEISGFNFSTGGFGVTQFHTFEPAPVPLPAAAWLFGSGLAGLFGFTRRKKTPA
ncbi:MAG: VPLPA-CTERM sorting domain-containing protein [Sulfuricaulis sp.]